MNKKTLIILGIIVIMCLTVMILNLKKDEEINNTRTFQITNFEIENRVCVRENNEFYIGENRKQIENGFYDLKLVNENRGITVYLNKLWYEKYNKDYIQDEYLADICRKLVQNLKLKDNEQDLEYVLYKYIKENYLKARANESVEKILLDDMIISLEFEDNMSKLIIKGV